MDARVEGLADTIKNILSKLSEESKIKTYLDGNKIVSTVGIDGVRVRIAEPYKVKKTTKSAISQEQVDKIKEVKKNFKDNLNISNLLFLLIRVKEEINRVNMKQLPDDKLRLVERTLAEVSKVLNTRLLEVTK